MSVGYVTQGDESLRGRVENTLGSNVVTTDQLLRLIEHAIRNPRCGNVDESQIITCLADYDTLSKATSLEAAELANAALVSKLAAMFNIPTTEIDTNLPLPHYGVDSLVTVELRSWLSSKIKAKVTIFEILQGASIGEFAALVAKRKGS